MSGEGEFELVMPFVICQSNGGPHDDVSFVAGFECGRIDAALEAGIWRRFGTQQTVRADSLPQLDLIAMRYGYVIERISVSECGEWAQISIRATNNRTGDPR